MDRERLSRRRTCAGIGALVGVGLLGSAVSSSVAAADPVPAGPSGLASLGPIGAGTMRVFGLAIYDARLWAAPRFSPSAYAEATLALELHYRRSFSADAIAQRSLEEMQRIEDIDEIRTRRWRAALAHALPDVQAGDRLLGVHRPDVGAEFWQNGRMNGRLDDPDFSRRFFGIWLAPQTSAPELRQALLARVQEPS